MVSALPRIVLIAAHDRQRAIGHDGRMPWHLPADLRRFRALTMGHPLLMGRKTWEAIGRPLPGRRNLVLSRQPGLQLPGAEVLGTLEEVLRAVSGEELWVIGGGEIYALALPLASRMELTQVDTTLTEADAWFPGFDPKAWRRLAREPHPADERHAYAYAFESWERMA